MGGCVRLRVFSKKNNIFCLFYFVSFAFNVIMFLNAFLALIKLFCVEAAAQTL